MAPRHRRLGPGSGGVEPAVPSALACFGGPNHHQNCKCWAIFGGEASKNLGWLRFFWKTWIESCPILRLKKTTCQCSAQFLCSSTLALGSVQCVVCLGFSKNGGAGEKSKSTESSFCYVLLLTKCLFFVIDPLKAWIHLADSPQRPRGFQIPSGKARCAPTWKPAAAGRAAAAGC